MKTAGKGVYSYVETEQWINSELGYVRHLIRFIFNEEASRTPGIRFQMDNLLESGGKMLRPKLVIFGARIALGKTRDYPAHILPATEYDDSVLANIRDALSVRTGKWDLKAAKNSEFERWKKKVPFEGALENRIYLIAAAIEILHMATLVHDDIIDSSPSRRGRPSANALSGNGRAVLLGDLLFTICLSLVNESASRDTGRVLSESIRQMVRGELMQSRDNENFRNLLKNPSKRKYIRVIASKTAVLFSLSLICGASECGADDKLRENLGRIGFSAGLSFQIRDDEMDYLSNEKKTGKPCGQDIKEGKITLPLILALKNNRKGLESGKQKLLQAIEDFRAGDESGLSGISAEITALGGFCASRQISDIYMKRASGHLKQLEKECPCPGPVSLLRNLLGFIQIS